MSSESYFLRSSSILGISIFGCSVWILFDKSNFISVLNSEDDMKVVAGGLFVIGLVVVGVSVLGCMGVHLESRCLIALYMGLLITIVLGQLFVTFLLVIKRNQIVVALTNSIDTIISDYGSNTTQGTSARLLDSAQESAQCCGRMNTSDWQTNKLIRSLNMTDVYPCSCFNGSCPVFSETSLFGKGSEVYAVGCGAKLNDWFQENLLVIVGMDLGLLAIQILQFALGVHIYRNIALKIKDLHSMSLLPAMEEENGALEAELQQSHQEHYQAPDHTYDQQPQSTQDQESPAESYYQHDQRQQYHYDLEASSHLHEQRLNPAYAQEQPLYQHYQHRPHPEPTTHSYDHKQHPDYHQDYVSQDQYNHHGNDPDYHYDHGYVRNYNEY
ncbi:CD82 antigen [Hoplias malabaricus]|uniref:CD82 antigen n=1 Tax=Hoplias malabaricus TaxID=27720 RepID=UPI0034627605